MYRFLSRVVLCLTLEYFYPNTKVTLIVLQSDLVASSSCSHYHTKKYKYPGIRHNHRQIQPGYIDPIYIPVTMARKTLSEMIKSNPTALGDPVSLKAETSDTSPTENDRPNQNTTNSKTATSMQNIAPSPIEGNGIPVRLLNPQLTAVEYGRTCEMC